MATEDGGETMTAAREAPAKAVCASALLARETVEHWPGGLLAAGFRVVAPVGTATESEYVELSTERKDGAKATALGLGLPKHSPKGTYFPRSEPILCLSRQGKEWSVADPALVFPRTVLFGVRACDAAAPEILGPLFGWDYHDPFFEERLKGLARVVVGCAAPVDESCFCTSVGIDPAGEGYGDVLLTPRPGGGYLAEAYTQLGEELLNLIPASERKAAPPDQADVKVQREAARKAIPRKFDLAAVCEGLEQRFEDPLWERAARSCIACGTCAFVCPTCHCFDIQEEVAGRQGVRQKNWDACAFPLFTQHTSGHNPRPDQGARWRQRLSHKFRYYPEKFGRVLCTGCGRCLRLCPAGMDLLADLAELSGPAVAGPSHDREGAAETPLADARGGEPRASPPVGSDARGSNALPGAALAPHVCAATPLAGQAVLCGNIYKPYRMRVAALRDETPDVRTLRLEFAAPNEGAAFAFQVGQFGLYSAFGHGEATFCIASAPTRKGYLECTFRKAGRVTKALRNLDVGDLLGFRGPYGNVFPVEAWKGRNLLFIAGGIALPPLRCVIQYCLDRRADYRDITIVYGARTWADHVYKDELAEWEKRPDAKLWLCVDWQPKPEGGGLSEAAAEEGWRPLNAKDPGASALDPAQRRYTGFVPQLVEAAKPSAEGCVAVVCGPPIMIKFTLQSLKKLGFQAENVYTTLENRMKCGLGKCGRCNVGPIYVCKEGPVFTAAQLEQLPAEL